MKYTVQHSTITSESGNALFLILIAVALFAILSYAITQSSSGGGTVNKEQAMLSASQILQYASNIKTAVQRLRLINGCDDTEINFNNSKISGYNNPNAPADGSCDIFDKTGAGITYQLPKPSWLDDIGLSHSLYGYYHFTGSTCIFHMPNDPTSCWSDGIDNEELLLSLSFISKDTCLAINEKFDISSVDGEPPEDRGCGVIYTRFTGSYSGNTSINASNVPAINAFTGKYAGCYKATSECSGTPNGYHFYYVLLAR